MMPAYSRPKDGFVMQHTISAIANGDAGQTSLEKHRPVFHYSPKRNWMNDPNGLVWFEGEYHLFYQYNPHGIEWGHMSWGHAVSTDLVRWVELPVAIPEGKAMIFSGSAIVDHDNVSGLGDGINPPILAFYTEHFPEPGRIERQSLAYSNDRGRTFQQFAGNPLVDIGCANFRDPKVFYHGPSKAWIMIVALSQDFVINFYRSTNLLDWAPVSTFGPAGSVAGQWECADLFYCRIKDRLDEGRWVLKVDVDDGIVAGGSGSQYFVGDFDGYCFTCDPSCGGDVAQTVDCGPDFYASASWSNLPSDQPDPLFLAWMSNQQSGRYYPTSPWRGVMSVPRTLQLVDRHGVLTLTQTPVASLASLRENESSCEGQVLAGLAPTILAQDFECADIEFTLQPEPDAVAVLELGSGDRNLLRIELDRGNNMIRFHRVEDLAISSHYERSTSRAVDMPGGIALRVLVDRSTVEIFVNGGELVYSVCLFPRGTLFLRARSSVGKSQVSPVRLWSLAV